MTTVAHDILAFVDDPADVDGWSDGKDIADRAHLPRRSVASTLRALERRGLVESRPVERHGIWVAKHPGQWRLSRKGAAL